MTDKTFKMSTLSATQARSSLIQTTWMETTIAFIDKKNCLKIQNKQLWNRHKNKLKFELSVHNSSINLSSINGLPKNTYQIISDR